MGDLSFKFAKVDSVWSELFKLIYLRRACVNVRLPWCVLQILFLHITCSKSDRGVAMTQDAKKVNLHVVVNLFRLYLVVINLRSVIIQIDSLRL